MLQLIRTVPFLLMAVQIQAQDICMVTADEPTGEDYIVIWNHPSVNEEVDSIFIYRKQGTQLYFHKIGAVVYEETGTNQFTDAVANTQDTTKYAIAYRYTDGTVSNRSLWHQAVVLDYAGTGNFTWTPYKIEDQEDNSFITSYELMKDDNASGNFLGLGTLLNSLLSTLDLTFLLTPNAQYRIHTELPSCEALEKANIHTSRSNIKQQVSNPPDPSVSNPNADAEYEENLGGPVASVIENTHEFFVFPNPSYGTLSIAGGALITETRYEMHNMMGRMVLSGSLTPANNVIDVNQLKPGVYLLQIVDQAVIRILKK